MHSFKYGNGVLICFNICVYTCVDFLSTICTGVNTHAVYILHTGMVWLKPYYIEEGCRALLRSYINVFMHSSRLEYIKGLDVNAVILWHFPSVKC